MPVELLIRIFCCAKFHDVQYCKNPLTSALDKNMNRIE